MLTLKAVCDPSNIIVSENGHKTISDSDIRKKAGGQAIMDQELQEGMTFVLKLRGTGVIKMYTFKSKHAAKNWFKSGCCFPKDCQRLRHGHDNRILLVSVFQTHLVFTPMDHHHAIKLTRNSDPCILAFDIECGDISISVGNLKSHGIPIETSQYGIFKYYSHHLDKTVNGSDSPQEETICPLPLKPNPLSLCKVDDFILSRGNLFDISITKTQRAKDTGAYVRIWFIPSASSTATQNKCSKILSLERSAALHLRVKDNAIIICNSESVPLDTVPINVAACLWELAFEIYNVSLSVASENLLTCPLGRFDLSRYLPRDHNEVCLARTFPRRHKALPRDRTPNINPQQQRSQGLSTSSNTYLTPIDVNPEPAHCHGNNNNNVNESLEMRRQNNVQREETPNNYCSVGNRSPNVSQYNEVLKLKDPSLIIPVQETNGDRHVMFSDEQTEVKQMSETEIRQISETEVKQMSEMETRQISETEMRHISETEVKQISETEVKQISETEVKQISEMEDNPSYCEEILHRNMPRRLPNNQRISEFNDRESYHQTVVKTVHL